MIFQPILFGLIGAEVDVTVLEGRIVGYGVLSLVLSLLGRIILSVLIAYGGSFNWKEKIFIAWAWFPKATVQVVCMKLFERKVKRRFNPQRFFAGCLGTNSAG